MQLVHVFTTLKLEPILHVTSDQAPDIVAEEGGCVQLFLDKMDEIQQSEALENGPIKELMDIIKV